MTCASSLSLLNSDFEFNQLSQIRGPLSYPDYVDIDNRGALYYAIVSSVNNFGASTVYLSGAKDKNGLYLDGSKTAG